MYLAIFSPGSMQFAGGVCPYLTDTSFIEGAVSSHQYKLESGRGSGTFVLEMVRLSAVVVMIVSHGFTNALFGKGRSR